MLTDLVQIRRLGEQKRDENERFRKHLKRHNFVERKFRRIAQEVEDAIDCMECANCCRLATVRLAQRDVEKLSRFLRLRPAEFLRDHTTQSPEEGLILKRTDACIFLDGNTCTVYEARPHICETFPHVVKGDGSLVARMWDFKDRACYCPIVYNTLEAFKAEVNFQKG
jgi:Fe-S-cluster containining protein